MIEHWRQEGRRSAQGPINGEPTHKHWALGVRLRTRFECRITERCHRTRAWQVLPIKSDLHRLPSENLNPLGGPIQRQYLFCQAPAGFPRDTYRFPVKKKRHSFSRPELIPILPDRPIGATELMPRASQTTSPHRSVPFSSRVISRAWQSLAGPLKRSSSGRTPLREAPRSLRMRSIPRTGSSARMSTAQPVPSGSVTTLLQKCIPYVKYTYKCPPSPNMTAFRSVLPL